MEEHESYERGYLRASIHPINQAFGPPAPLREGGEYVFLTSHVVQRVGAKDNVPEEYAYLVVVIWEWQDDEEEDDEEDAPLIDDLDFSVRTANILDNMRVKTVADLAELTEDDILEEKNASKRTVGEIRDALEKLGMRLRSDEE